MVGPQPELMAVRWTARPPPAASRPKVASQREALLPVPALTRREAWPLAPEPALRREALPLELEQVASQPRALPLEQALSLPAAWLRQAPSE